MIPLDPSVGTFQMCYDDDGLVMEWDKTDNRLFPIGTASRRTGSRSAVPNQRQLRKKYGRRRA